MSESKLGTWTVPESPINIEYSVVVIDEIRRAVTEGYQKLSRGGIEVGGLLYGVREGETIRLLATRPIACEHAKGPAFQFSDNDRAALTAQLKYTDEDPPLKDLVCLGWFVSHTRTGIQLSESDLEIFNTYFPDSWQVTLVVRPGRAMSMRAGFFIREFDGTLRTEASYQEFNFPDRVSSILERPARSEGQMTGRRGPYPGPQGLPEGPGGGTDLRIDGGSAAPAFNEYARPGVDAESNLQYERRPFETPQAEFSVPPSLAAAPAQKKWLWLVVWAVVLAGLSYAALQYLGPKSQPEPIGLALAEKDGALQVQWNRAAGPVAGAARGNLEFTDGTNKRSVALNKADLANGSFLYQRSSGDIEVRLIVESPGGAKVQEVSRYLGQAPVPAAKAEESEALQQKRDQLQQEVERLRALNADQSARIQQLERTVRILQTRLGQK